MARELKIRIQVEDTPAARAALASVEQGLKQVEVAGGKASTVIGNSSSPENSKSVVGGLKALRSAMVGVGVGTVIKNIVEFGSRLTDLSAQTGISVSGLQKLDAVGRTVGVSLEAAARGVNMMQRNLIGDKGAQKAVADLGLSVQQLLAMKPDEAFISIAREIAKLPDPAQRTAVAWELLGRSGAQYLPLLLADVEKLTKGMKGMSDGAVAGLDAFSDMWANMSRAVQSDIGTVVGGFGQIAAAIENLLSKFSGADLASVVSIGGGFARFKEIVSGLYSLPSTAPPALDAISMSAGATGAELDKLMQAQDKLNDETERSIKEAEAYNKKIDELADTLSGKALAAKVDDLTAAYKRLTPQQLESKVTQDALIEQVMELKAQGAKLPPVLQDIWRETAKAEFNQLAMAKSTKTLAQNLEDMLATAPSPVLYEELFERGAKAMREQAIPSLQQTANATAALDRETRVLDRAYDTLGMTSRRNLQQQARDAEQAYADIARYGNASADELEEAWQRVLEAQQRASGETVMLWRDTFHKIGETFFRFGDQADLLVQRAIGGPLGKALGGVTSMVLGSITSLVMAGIDQLLFLAADLAIQGLKRLGQMIWSGLKSIWNGIKGWFGGGDENRGVSPDVPSGGGPDPVNPNNPYVNPTTGQPYDPSDPPPSVDPNIPPGTSAPDWSHLQGFAQGGFVPARPGGTVVRVGEGGEGEFITPWSKAGGGATVHLHMEGAIIASERLPHKFVDQITRALASNVRRLQTA